LWARKLAPIGELAPPVIAQLPGLRAQTQTSATNQTVCQPLILLQRAPLGLSRAPFGASAEAVELSTSCLAHWLTGAPKVSLWGASLLPHAHVCLYLHPFLFVCTRSCLLLVRRSMLAGNKRPSTSTQRPATPKPRTMIDDCSLRAVAAAAVAWGSSEQLMQIE